MFAILASVTTALTTGWAPVLGALHALEPGHGKSLVAAYLVGTRGRISDAVLLGFVVTLTHTAAAIALGAAVALFGDTFREGAARQGLQIASASLVVLIGGWMFWRLTRGGHHHHHGHGHDHDHAHEHDHEHEHEEEHDHAHAHAPRTVFGRGGLIGLGVSGGLIPCPAALAVVVSLIGRTGTWTALLTVLLFSTGMGVVLTAIAIAVVKFKGLLTARVRESRWTQYVPAASAAIVTVMGVVLLALAIIHGGDGGHTH